MTPVPTSAGNGSAGPLVALVGPTASGKTEVSLGMARALGAEIVSVDAMVVYRGMDAGTAKPSPTDRLQVPHHLIDVADPDEPFSVARFQEMAREAVTAIRARERTPFLVGGSGLYYRAVVDDLEFPGTERPVRGLLEVEASVVGPAALHARLASFDPAAAGRIEPANVRRTVRALEVAAITGRPFSTFAAAWERYPADAVRAAGIDVDRAALHRRIDARVATMMPGLLRETEGLLAGGFGPFLTSSQAIGYAEAVAVLRGTMTWEDATAVTARRTKALARRQMSWFRRDPRIRWFTAGDCGATEVATEVLEHLGSVEV